jgi:hypothetical protein
VRAQRAFSGVEKKLSNSQINHESLVASCQQR